MLPTINAIKAALTAQLKNPDFVIKATISSGGYKMPVKVYFDLEYSMASGARAHVSSEGIEEGLLKADEQTINAIRDDLQGKFRGRKRR